MAVHAKSDGKLGAQLRLYPQQRQDMGICGGLVGAFLGQSPLNGVAVHPVGLVGIRVPHLHVGLIERDVRRHAQKAAQAPGLDERIVFQFLKLLLCQVLEGTVGPASRLPEVALLNTLVDGEGDGEK